MTEYANGELFVYVNGDRWELGMVKRPNDDGDGYFCWYSTGDTAANTPTWCMHKLANHGFTKIEGILRSHTNVARRINVSNVDTDYATGHCACSACGKAIDFWDGYCRRCGAKLEGA